MNVTRRTENAPWLGSESLSPTTFRLDKWRVIARLDLRVGLEDGKVPIWYENLTIGSVEPLSQ